MNCEECGTPIAIPEDAEPGELLDCPSCAIEYEILSLAPPKLAIFEEDEK